MLEVTQFFLFSFHYGIHDHQENVSRIGTHVHMPQMRKIKRIGLHFVRHIIHPFLCSSITVKIFNEIHLAAFH